MSAKQPSPNSPTNSTERELHRPTGYPRLWIFDGNRRIYPKAEKGRMWASGGPIYREHWMEHEITGETRVSWITKWGVKVPKKGGRGIAFSLQEVEDDVWMHDNQHKISEAVRDIRSVALLRKVAALLEDRPR